MLFETVGPGGSQVLQTGLPAKRLGTIVSHPSHQVTPVIVGLPLRTQVPGGDINLVANTIRYDTTQYNTISYMYSAAIQLVQER